MISNPVSPIIYAIAGVPTAGKSSFRIQAINKGILPTDTFVHDCDEVMESLPGYQQQLAAEGPAPAFNNWELPAREIAEQLLQNQIAAKRDIIYDRSCALTSSFEFIHDTVTQHDYKLIMYLLFISADEAKNRALDREAQINRHTPEYVINERIQMLSFLWSKYLQLATEAYLFDNSEYKQKLVATYKDRELSITDQNAYNNFLAYAAAEK